LTSKHILNGWSLSSVMVLQGSLASAKKLSNGQDHQAGDM
jgi:hypothetical protein